VPRDHFLAHSVSVMKNIITLSMLFGIFLLGATVARSETPLQPSRHLSIKNPARLTVAEALSVYDTVSDQMFKGYAASDAPTAKAFGKWQRYNNAPYNSATHGNRYINNYANARAAQYGKLKPGQQMPEGAIIAKDSFTVTKDRKVYAGALFIMEKLAPGASPDSGDWRYQMVMPDGSLFGDTEGTGAKEVAFCHGCHIVKKNDDFLYFFPQKFRRVFLD
jgi:hypothetical protein